MTWSRRPGTTSTTKTNAPLSPPPATRAPCAITPTRRSSPISLRCWRRGSDARVLHALLLELPRQGGCDAPVAAAALRRSVPVDRVLLRRPRLRPSRAHEPAATGSGPALRAGGVRSGTAGGQDRPHRGRVLLDLDPRAAALPVREAARGRHGHLPRRRPSVLPRCR